METGSLCEKLLTEDTVQSHPLVASVLCWDGLGGATSVPEEAASECVLWVIERIARGTVF